MPGFVDVSGWSKRDVQRLGHEDDDDQPTPQRRYSPPPAATYTADQVWACAAAAHRINDGYFKEPVWNTDVTPATVKTNANKLMVRHWLQTGNFTEVTAADIAQGQVVRQHFYGYLMLQLSGKINDFQTTALKAAHMDTFTNKDTMQVSVISCLPYIMLKDRLQRDLMDQIRSSDQVVGELGATVQGVARIVKTWYSAEYMKYRTTAAMNGGFVDFWFAESLEVGSEHTIKGKIKAIRGDNTTQLNYVKKVLTKS